MIRLENIGMIFAENTPDENIALKNINLNIKTGDFMSIIGSNGAGKSTLYNTIAGTMQPTSGRILLSTGKNEKGLEIEKDITKDKEHIRAHYIGRIFQNPLLGTAGKMSLEDNMVICYKKGYKALRKSLNNKMRDYFKSQLEILDMGLENRLKDNVELFSGGQRQALTLLMAVMSKPSLLLLDEHTAALDPHNAQVVMDLTQKFASEYNLTVMMITHNMNHALSFGNRLLMMDDGEILLNYEAADKKALTMNQLIKTFRDIKKKDLASDKLLLSL